MSGKLDTFLETESMAFFLSQDTKVLADMISVLEVAKDSMPIAALEDSSLPQESRSEQVEVLMCEVDDGR